MTKRQMSPQTCSACGEKGHNRRSKVCTKGKAQKKADLTCGKCKEKGHTASSQECPFYGKLHSDPEAKKAREKVASLTVDGLAKTVRAAIDREVERRVREVLEELIGAIDKSETMAEDNASSATDSDKE